MILCLFGRFHPAKGVAHEITRILKRNYDGPWPSYKEVPETKKAEWFDQFSVSRFLCVNVYNISSLIILHIVFLQQSYTWAPQHTNAIRGAFVKKAAKNLRTAMSYVRDTFKEKVAAGITDWRATWIAEEHWPDHVAYWESEGFIRKSMRGQRNISTDNHANNACGSNPLHERFFELVCVYVS